MKTPSFSPVNFMSTITLELFQITEVQIRKKELFYSLTTIKNSPSLMLLSFPVGIE